MAVTMVMPVTVLMPGVVPVIMVMCVMNCMLHIVRLADYAVGG